MSRLLAHQTLTFPRTTPLIILHGLLGSKQNFQSIAKYLHSQLQKTVVTLDLRNHGESFHSPIHTYEAMSNDVFEFIELNGFKQVSLLGHSMGGKVAMTMALQRPKLIQKMCIVDMAPLEFQLSQEIKQFFKYFREIEQRRLNLKEANDYLHERVREDTVRQFLMTNYKKIDNQYKFRVNLDALEASLEHLGSFPQGTSMVETLFIKGRKSGYVPESRYPKIKQRFPNSRIIELDAGHWVHFEKPKEFMNLCIDYFK